MNIAQLTAKLTLDVRDYSKNLRGAAREANKFSKQLSSQLQGFKDLAKETTGGFKDVSRIVQGIFVSKAIYGTINSIKEATESVWGFSNSLEYANMVYSNLFGNSNLSREFLNVLEDYAAKSPFEFSEAEAAAKRLMAYGIKANNIMYVLQGTLAAASGQGNQAVIEPISRALGQIYTKGKLTAEEMRQLAEAGIPAYEILREELGLTGDQLGKLGDLAIPANDAINALVDGINKKFGNILEQSSKTRTGMLSNIKDNLMMIAKDIFDAPINKIGNNVISPINDFLQEVRGIVSTQGVGGLFERLVPEEMRETIKGVIAQIRLFVATLIDLGKIGGTVFRELASTALPFLNILGATINSILRILVGFLQALTSTSFGMKALNTVLMVGIGLWTIWKARLLAAMVVKAIGTMAVKAAKGLAILNLTLQAMALNPIVFQVAAITMGLIGLAAASSDARASISRLVNNFTKFAGVDTDKLLLPSQKQRTADVEKFNNKLSTTGDMMDKLASATGKTTKAAKGLQQFDEVFDIKPMDSTDEIEAALEAWNGLDFEDYLPDFTDVGQAFADGIGSSIFDALGRAALGAGIGAILGAVIGGLIGQPILGAKIGAFAGAFVGLFWDNIVSAFKSNPSLWGNLIGAAIGGVIGGITLGGPLGVALGALVGALAFSFWEDLYDKLGEQADLKATLIASVLGAVLGTVIAGPGLGTVFGALGGAVAGGIYSAMQDGLDDTDKKILAVNGMSTIIGGMIGGMAIGGPIGAGIGALSGWIAGTFFGSLYKDWKKKVEENTEAAKIANEMEIMYGKIYTTVDENIKGREQTRQELTTQYGEIEGLVTRLMELVKKPVKSEADKAGITALVNDLNTTVPNLKLNYDHVNDSLNLQEQEIRKIIKAQQDLAMAQAFQEDLVQIYKDIWANEKLVNEENQAAIKIHGELLTAQKNLEQAYKDLGTATNGTTGEFLAQMGKVHELGTTVDILKDKLGESKTRMEEYTTQRGVLNADLELTKTKMEEIAIATGTNATTIETNVGGMVTDTKGKFNDLGAAADAEATKTWEAWEKAEGLATDSMEEIGNSATTTKDTVKTATDQATEGLKTTWTTTLGIIKGSFTTWQSEVTTIMENVVLSAKGKFDQVTQLIKEAGEAVKGFENPVLGDYNTNNNGGLFKPPKMGGHADGGIFNREHIARFAEGNKREAIIPLENDSAMKPFSQAVASDVISTLAPILASRNDSSETKTPVYVGALIADERGLRDLQRRMDIINMQDSSRKGGH